MNSMIVRRDLKNLKTLSTIPLVTKRLFEVLQNEKASLSELSDVIRHDQSLSHKIISVANSPYFGFYRKINSIEQAALMLGFDLVKSISLSMSIFKHFVKKDLFDMQKMWIHSSEVAFIAGLLCEKIPVASKGICFLGGLLHDIGKLVFFMLYTEKYSDISDRKDLTSAEYEVFECDHAVVGGWFLENTFLPEEICFSVKHHHDLEGLIRHRGIATVVYLAEALSDRLSSKTGTDTGSYENWGEEAERIFYEVGLGEKDMYNIEELFIAEQENLKRFFDLI